MAMVVNRFDVCLINLDPTVGSEIKKRTIIVAPMTTAGKDYPTRVRCTFKRKKGKIVLDQIRTIDKTRIIKKLGTIGPKTQLEVISVLQQLFAF